jgi:hypothetical protein
MLLVNIFDGIVPGTNNYLLFKLNNENLNITTI